MRRPWLPLRPRRDDSCAVGARRGARSRRRIKRLLSPPIAPRLEVLKRGAGQYVFGGGKVSGVWCVDIDLTDSYTYGDDESSGNHSYSYGNGTG